MLDTLREMPTWASYALCLGLFAVIVLGLAAVACAVATGLKRTPLTRHAADDLLRRKLQEDAREEWPLYDHDGDYGEGR